MVPMLYVPDTVVSTVKIPLLYSTWNSIFENALRLLSLPKTDKSKMSYSLFGGKVLTEKKSPPLFLGQFSFRTIIFFVFVFSFSLFKRIGSENAVGGSWGSI
jgi:hypothetical protein